MTLDLPRRGFMAGLCATTAKAAVTPAHGDTAPIYRNAVDLIQALVARQISSRELVDGAISRIEALDPKINAVVVRDFDRARTAADAADAALGRASAARCSAADDGQGAIQRRRPADDLGLPEDFKTGAPMSTPSRCSG